MSKPLVFVTRRIPQNGLDLLAASCEVLLSPHDRPLTREEFLSGAAKAQGVLGMLSDRIDGEFFDAAPELKGYANFAVGFDNIDVAEATRRKLPVSNTPDVLTLATAELALALMLCVARRVVECDAVMRSGTWPGWGPLQFIGQDVSGKTLGIFGPGRIATALAKLTAGFEMPVIYCGRRPNPELEACCQASGSAGPKCSRLCVRSGRKPR